MIALNLPAFKYKAKQIEDKQTIFDPVRRKYVVLTPEEWVRQHFLNYLIFHLNYSKSLIKVESGLIYNKLQKRSDIKVYNRTGNLFMLIECKAYNVSLNENTLHQISTYNHKLGAEYLVVTNGLLHFCWYFDKINDSIIAQSSLPAFV